ncbi:hypothetical protein Leryth_011828 [Lithospermum erythrorhizon]|nr:hypothetical protein Leryth_011828 [Lithospermum erythrorhizon]
MSRNDHYLGQISNYKSTIVMGQRVDTLPMPDVPGTPDQSCCPLKTSKTHQLTHHYPHSPPYLQ